MNPQTIRNFVLFLFLSVALGAGWWYVNKEFFPAPPPKPPVEPVGTVRQARQGVVGGMAAVDPPVAPIPPRPTPKVEPLPTEAEPYQLVALGGGPGFYKRVLLTSRGAAVQQVILPEFDESTREGKDCRAPDGKVRPLHLLPGTPRLREKTVRQQWNYPNLQPGLVGNTADLAEPSYVLMHYPAVGDPARLPEEKDVKPDAYPTPLLAGRHWKLVEQVQGTKETEAKVVFETKLEAPYFILIRKIYTLAAKEYHLGLKLEFSALPGRPAITDKDRPKFRYQIAGARDMPLEGEWYTSTYRNAFIGWATPNGTAKRTIEDAAAIHTGHGGIEVRPTDGPFTYAGVGTQYFASVLAVDDKQPDEIRKNLWASVRPTREPWPGYDQMSAEKLAAFPNARFLGDEPDKAFLGDITVRAVSNTIDPQPGQSVTHQYLIYNGPLKVRLLKQLEGDKAVSPELVDRYLDKLTLKTMTDYHSPHFFGRLANSIFWADLVILFTNLMHSILGGLHSFVPVWGLDILILTVMVRLMLVVPSRKQQIMMANMQAKMAAMKPELDKLKEKFKDDYQGLNQAKTRLMLQHGVNPLSSLSGCLLMFAQMPVFLGLYFCLQESIFFRLESFLWLPNLAGPDMLVWWTEGIPWISDPDALGGMLYLGPYFNILPITAVALMFFHQKLSMPPPTDEQQATQQKMMKYMMIVMGVFFYKMAAGLCLYFIASTTWGLIERKLIPKPVVLPPGTGPAPGGTPVSLASPPAAPAAPGFFGRMREKVEEMKRQAEEQSGRQIRNDTKPTNTPRDKKKKRK